MEDFWKTFAPLITQYGVRIIGAILVLFVGWIVAKWAGD
jgi:hypothetical protein